MCLDPSTLPMVLRGRCSFANTSRTTARSRVVLILFILIDHSTPPLFGSRHCMGSLGFRWSYADNFGVLTRGANATSVHRTSHFKEGRSRCSRHIPSPAEGQMFSVIKCLQPTRVAVDLANGYHVFDQSRGPCLRVVASAGERWSSSMVTNLCWRSASVVRSRFLMPASNLHARPTRLLGNHGQLCDWKREHVRLLRSDWRCLHLYGCIGKGLRFRGS